MIKALQIPSDINLAAFSQFLKERGLQHRIAEEGPNQVLWVSTDREVELVTAVYARYQAGELDLQGAESSLVPLNLGSRIAGAMARFPLTLALIAINIVLFPVGMGLSEGNFGLLFSKMTFLATERVAGTLYFSTLGETLASGELWRIFTPMFVHFSWLHIAFNLLWVWEVGRRIEFINGALMLFGLVLFSSAVANSLQLFMSGPALFGGMSGVVFGLLAYSMVWSWLMPAKSMALPRAIYIFMLAYLVIGFTGAIDLLGLGNLANGAHLGGLLAGLITGGIAGLVAQWNASSAAD